MKLNDTVAARVGDRQVIRMMLNGEEIYTISSVNYCSANFECGGFGDWQPYAGTVVNRALETVDGRNCLHYWGIHSADVGKVAIQRVETEVGETYELSYKCYDTTRGLYIKEPTSGNWWYGAVLVSGQPDPVVTNWQDHIAGTFVGPSSGYVHLSWESTWTQRGYFDNIIVRKIS